MSEYGLTVHDLNYTKQKITKQREFLEKNTFLSSKGQVKSLLDVSFSANHSERYYSQILNKVHTMDSYALSINYVPIFMTVTLDAPFHEMVEGKFEKFYKKYKIVFGEIIELSTGEVITNLVPNNDRYGFLIDAIEQERRLSIKDLYRILSFQLHGFQMSYVFKKIRKEENEVSYLRVTEPMKSGVPHFHLLLYTKEEYIKGLYDSFHKYFSAPQNSKPLSYRDNKRICTKPLEDGTQETQGFQWDINSATGYVLKYVLKSFRNVQNEEEIDYLQAWYIEHRIPRIITSHTLVPQWVYHIMQVIDKDWYYQTDLKKNHSFSSDSLNKKFEFNDYDFNRKITYDNGLLRVYNNNKLMTSHGTKKYAPIKLRLKSLKFTDKKPTNFNILQRFEFYKPIFKQIKEKAAFFEDGTELIIDENSMDMMFTFLEDFDDPIREKILSVKEMSDLTLLELYRANNFQSMLSARYFNIQNELVRRGLKDMKIVDLNNATLKEEVVHSYSTFLEDAKVKYLKQ